ncbi:hypothetical protein K3495_g17376, partial [Podosphaera aphanis]
YTVEYTKKDFAWNPKISNEQSKQKAPSEKNDNRDEVDELTKAFDTLGGNWDQEKALQFEVDEASALYLISRSLNEDDNSAMEEYATAYEIWKFLNSKYNKTNEATVDKIMTRIQTFDYDPEKGIDGSWEKLKELRRKLVSADKTLKNLYPDRSLFLIFTRSLPSEYKATKDGLRL